MFLVFINFQSSFSGDAFTLSYTVVMLPVSQLWSVQGQHRRVILEPPATTHCILGATVKHRRCENHSLMDRFSGNKKINETSSQVLTQIWGNQSIPASDEDNKSLPVNVHWGDSRAIRSPPLDSHMGVKWAECCVCMAAIKKKKNCEHRCGGMLECKTFLIAL